jgi:hypothetical protein
MSRKRVVIIVSCLVIVAILLAYVVLSTVMKRPTATLTVNVVDANINSYILAATVVATGPQSLSGVTDGGTIAFENSQTGTYSVTASKAGYSSASENVNLTENAEITIRLKPLTYLYIDPPMTKRAVGQDFSVNASISSVTDLYGWQLQLSWNRTILDVESVADVTEGTFLKNHASTFFIPNINETSGLLSAYDTLTGNVSGVNGSGVLATVRFHVTGNGECGLHLSETILVSSSESAQGLTIAHAADESGKFST